MARKRPPASPERKKLREKWERASALSKRSSVKADKKQGYEIKLTDLYANCTGRGQLDTLSKLVSPALPD